MLLYGWSSAVSNIVLVECTHRCTPPTSLSALNYLMVCFVYIFMLQYYNFTTFAMTLNELVNNPPLADNLPPTDCRLRPDMRLMEEGDIGEWYRSNRVYTAQHAAPSECCVIYYKSLLQNSLHIVHAYFTSLITDKQLGLTIICGGNSIVHSLFK